MDTPMARCQATDVADGKASAQHGRVNGADNLRFNRQLWSRFRGIAQPYFYPAEEGGAAWARVILALLLGVLGSAYWLVACLFGLVHLLAPASLLSAELSTQVQQLWSLPWPLVGTALMIAAAAIVQRHKRHLRDRIKQWLMLGVLLFLMLCVSGLNVFISYVFRGIDNKLMEKDQPGFYRALWGFTAALVVAVPIIGAYRFMRLKLARHWRGYLCEFFLEGYLANRTFYKLDSNSQSTDIDNPDQRLTEDIDYFTSETLQFLLDVLGGILDLFSFTAILWATSKPLMGSLLAYAFVGTLIAVVVGQRLVEINYEQLRKEADLRYSLVRIRDNAEAIAFYGGEQLEGAAVRERLGFVMVNYDRLIRWTSLITMYQKMFDYLARVVPYLVIGGLYFEGKVDFGTMGQGAFAFDMVLSSVTLIVTRIKEISRFSAGVNRLGALYDELHLEEGDGHTSRRRGGLMGIGKSGEEELGSLVEEVGKTSSSREVAGSQISTTYLTASVGLELEEMTLQTPTGRTLVERLSLELSSSISSASPRREQSPMRLLIVGPSGFGKSSVLRAIAGLWSRGAGRIRRPATAEMLFLPQKPYMPLGDLRTQLLYPDLLADSSDEELTKSLALLGLGDMPRRFPGGFDAVQDWARILSVGEQQRLAAARCLVKFPAPALAVLDEATSALPLRDEANLYQLLQKRGICYISVGHRESLLDFHDLVLEICGGGAWRVWKPNEYRFNVDGAQQNSGFVPSATTPQAGVRNSSDHEDVAGGLLRRRDRTPDGAGPSGI